MSKALQQALERSNPARVTAKPAGQKKAESSRQAGRDGLDNVSGWFPPSVNKSFAMIRVEDPKRTKQSLMLEAYNLLFERYGVPTVAED